MLETLFVDDAGANLVVLPLRDTHLLESGERRENRATNPYRMLSLRWRNNSMQQK